MIYLLMYSAPYEGERSLSFYSLTDVKEWLVKNQSAYDFDLDNVEVLKVEASVNLYDLMKD